jgi:hypothetical protein
MRNAIKLAAIVFLLVHTVNAQVNPVVSPAANVPKLVIPATFAGKLKIADSLQKLKTPAGVMLKTFMPQYSPQFQDQLSEALLLIAKTQWSNNHSQGFNETVGQLINTVRTEYPQITRANIYKIFYKMSYSLIELRGNWAWLLDDLLSVSYGEKKNYLILTGPKYLKEAKLDISEVFSYYSGTADFYFFLKVVGTYPVNQDTLRKYSPQTIVGGMLQAGYTPEVIYEHMRKSGLRIGDWLMGFCKANAEALTPVETVARILKKDYYTNEELVYLLSYVPGYNSQANLLKAQQAN